VQLAFTTVEELHRLLEQAGEALDYREVWPRLFPVANCPPELMRRLVDDIVRDDGRFVWESDVHLGLRAWRRRRRDLAEVAFTVVDLETTGTVPGFARITEIGAVRLEGGREVAAFSSLVDPGVPIPPFITAITGIDDATVAGAPSIAEVLPRFAAFARDSVLVAHNAPFDLGFLDYELTRLERRTFPRPALDTLRLARHLLPRERCSLDALAERFGTRTRPRHRALDDARATAELLLLFLARLEEQGVTTLEEVARWCEPAARRNYHKIALSDGLPTTPGVYIMRDARGAPLYIGKAANLRRRVRDHFLQRQAYKARQALELLARVDVVETGSEFAALLLEARLIARHRPPCNSHGTRAGAYHYLKLTAEEHPRLYATPNLRDDGALYVGPFRKASLARRVAECLNGVYPLRTCSRPPAAAAGKPPRTCPRADTGLCLAPCRRPLNGEYAAAVAAVREVLAGRPDDLFRRLERRQRALADALAFEQAARLRNQREAVERALRAAARLRAAAAEHAVLVYPARRRGFAALWGVRGGRVVVEREHGRHAFDEAAALAFLRDLAAAEPPPGPFRPDEVDEALLVHGWLEEHRASVHVLDLRDELGGGGEVPLAAAAELVRRLRLVVA